MNAQQTEAQRRAHPSNENHGYITKRIGSTTYRVKVVFAPVGKETIEDKILRMFRNETDTGGAQ